MHLDISDAVNVLTYVGDEVFTSSDKITKKDNKVKIGNKTNDFPESINSDILNILLNTKCDETQIKRFLNGEKPGALWHIFRPENADTIRNYFAIETAMKGKLVDNTRDPIHDQINYIDNNILGKLKKEFNVEAYTIIQFLGDAVFIPAGAPHQVRNLNSCIKVALDFVSPYSVGQCISITDQLRHLNFKHTNREDKLQIKNILFHTVKECLNDLIF